VFPSIYAVKTFLIHKGYVAKHEKSGEKVTALLRSVSEVPKRYLESSSTKDVIKLDIKYQDWLLLKQDRDSALQNGYIDEVRNLVNAEIFYNNVKYNAKVRLQGDGLDHVSNSTRWSFRFELKKTKSVIFVETICSYFSSCPHTSRASIVC
jgi:hypothetical protein